MRVVFVRHGAPRTSEADPSLTSEGRSMASEAGEWLFHNAIMADWCLLTPTRRTRETAEEVLERWPHVRQQVVPELPETASTWDRLVAAWEPRLGDHGVLLLVGHHPTQEFLLAHFGPPPVPPLPGGYAATIVVDRVFTGAWTITGAWPGRLRDE